MTLYVDSSALLKRYLDEPDSDRWNELLSSDAAWLTSRLTWVEVWRNLGRRLSPEVVAQGGTRDRHRSRATHFPAARLSRRRVVQHRGGHADTKARPPTTATAWHCDR